MASVEQALPSYIKMRDKSRFGTYRPGVEMVRGAGGLSHVRTWSDHELLTYELDADYLKQSEDGLREFKHFLRRIDTTGSFWLKEPIPGDHFDMMCGPLGDASRTCFPLPIYGTATNDGVFVDNVPTTAYTKHALANLMPNDTEATAGAVASYAFTTCSGAMKYGHGLVAPDSILVTPTAACQIAHDNYCTVAASTVYTAIIAVYPLVTQNLRAGVKWYTDVPAYLSTGLGSSTSCTAGEWTILTAELTSPGTAARAIVQLDQPGAETSGFFFSAVGLAPDTYDRWHLPSMAPNVIEMDSAPATGERVSAYAEGSRLTRAMIERAATAWEMFKPGHANPSRLSVMESPEF